MGIELFLDEDEMIFTNEYKELLCVTGDQQPVYLFTEDSSILIKRILKIIRQSSFLTGDVISVPHISGYYDQASTLRNNGLPFIRVHGMQIVYKQDKKLFKVIPLISRFSNIYDPNIIQRYFYIRRFSRLIFVPATYIENINNMKHEEVDSVQDLIKNISDKKIMYKRTIIFTDTDDIKNFNPKEPYICVTTQFLTDWLNHHGYGDDWKAKIMIGIVKEY